MSGWVKKFSGKYGRAIAFVLAVLLSLPLEWGIFNGLYLWLSPNIVINRVLAGHGLLVVHLLSVWVLGACFVKHRWFCRTLCPVGWGCARVGRWSFHSTRPSKHLRIGEGLALFTLGLSVAGVPILLILDPLVIFRTFFSAILLPVTVCGVLWGSVFLLILLSNLVVPMYWCRHICPLGGLQELVADGRRRPSVLLSRRNTLFLLGGWATGFVLSRKSHPHNSAVFLPPSAVKGKDFYTSCLRCGNCVQACPASIIRLERSTESAWRWQTPRLDLSNGYCLSDCVKCGQVCPSGALAPFSVEEKKKLAIGRAVVDETDCLLSRNRECDRCRSVCRYDAIRLSAKDLLMQIRIDPDNCVGCNACVLICPEQAIRLVACGVENNDLYVHL